MKYYDQKQPGKARVYFSLLFQVAVHHWGKSGQEFRQQAGGRSWHRHHRGVLTALFMVGPISPVTTSLGVAPSIVIWDLPHQTSVKKKCHRPVWCVHFLSWGYLFPNCSCLWPVDTRLASTVIYFIASHFKYLISFFKKEVFQSHLQKCHFQGKRICDSHVKSCILLCRLCFV